MNKWVYSFGDGQADGDGKMKNLLGGKGAGLAKVRQHGLAGCSPPQPTPRVACDNMPPETTLALKPFCSRMRVA